MYSFSSGILFGLPLVGLVYILCVIIYRLTLHPLAKYPGPFLAKITSWYDVYHSYRMDRHTDQLRCHQKYGKIVRYGPNFLVINTTEALKDVYTNAKSKKIRKGDMYTFLHDDGAFSVHTAIDEDVHSFRRRVMGHAFSEQALKGQEPAMIENIDKWLMALGDDASIEKKGWTRPKNMSTWSNYLTFDVLGQLCFGESFEMITSDKHRNFPQVMLSRASQFQIIGRSPVLHAWKWLQKHTPLEPYLNPQAFENFQKFRTFAGNALKSRFVRGATLEKQGSETPKDFVHYLQQARDPETGKGYKQSELLAELRLLIIAGSDTSSVTMAAVFYYLTRNPQALERVQKEIRGAFDNVDDIVTGPKLSSCVYLRAVIDEALRLAPAVPSSLHRTTTLSGTLIDSIVLPAGTNVGTSAFSIHRSPDCFQQPLSYRPERWLTEYTPAEEVAAAKKAFCAFSLGHRGCIGRTMAYNEMSIAFGKVLWQYDMRLAHGDTVGMDGQGLFALQDIFVVVRDGPMVEFRQRSIDRN